MAGRARDRNRPPRAEITALAAAEARRDAIRRRRRSQLIGTLAVLIVGSIVGLIVAFHHSGSGPGVASDSTGGATTTTAAVTTTTAAMPSAKGKPCVAMTGTPPTGAPSVPVVVGPPPTTLVKNDLTVGTGATVGAADTVTVDYIGVACSTGVIFDSSYKTGQPATFPLANVIQGWQQGIPGMKVGGERLLGIPSDLAYGATGAAPDIAPDEPLWFVVKVEKTQGTTQ